MNDLELWNFIKNKISQNENIILISVLHSEFSSPGKQGFKIVISKDKNLIGTIGGGIMEFNLVEDSVKYLKENKNVRIFKKLYHNPEAAKDKSGLICAGNQTIFIYTITPKELQMVDEIINSISKNKKAILNITPKGLWLDYNIANCEKFFYEYSDENKWHYKELIGSRKTVYVIGSGHIGLSVSKFLALLDFYVISFDNRSDVQSVSHNIFANEKFIIDYENISDYLSEGEDSYLVVVTASYPTDKIVLKQIAQKNFKYIGLMGSDTKINKIFNELKEEGIEPELLKRIHTPIGIQINSQTPDEIAVSISAEIIKVKNG